MSKAIYKNKKVVSVMLLLMVLFTSLSTSVFAVTSAIVDTTKKASLTIVRYENVYGKEDTDSTTNTPLANVEFTIYKVSDELIEEYGINGGSMLWYNITEGVFDVNNLEKVESLITGEDGTVKFENLELGNYFVAETNSPDNAESSEAFFIELPRTSDDGTSWNYDVTVYPKASTVYGNVTLTKYDEDGVTPLPGTVWELYYLDWSIAQPLSLEEDMLEKGYRKYDYEGNLTTDENGQIKIENLPAGDYKIIEVSSLEGYIIDQTAGGTGSIEFIINEGSTTVNLTTFNEKPDIKKEVKTTLGYGEAVGKYETDTAEWKVTVEIPSTEKEDFNSAISSLKTFYITDTLPTGIDYVENSLKVYGVKGETVEELTVDGDGNDIFTFSQEGKVMTIDFLNATYDCVNYMLYDLDEVYITYETTFNSNVTYGQAETNSATLTYTNKVSSKFDSDLGENIYIEESTYTTDPDTAEVHTGKLLVKKTDGEGNFLPGAKFKIATTEDNAKEGIYVKGADGEDLVATSDTEGNVIFEGLSYGADDVTADQGESYYYLTEIESPTYEEDGETKHYNLLSSPVEVVVNSTSGEYEAGTTTEIVNKKGFTLPVTGATGAIIFIAVGITLMTVSKKLNKKEDVA